MPNPSSSLRGGRTRKFKSEINVVPYIDVMLVLLVIFMVAAPLTSPNMIDLPTAGKSVLPPTEYIEITLEPEMKSMIGIVAQKSGAGKPETADNSRDLMTKLNALHRKNPELPVMISADKKINYGEVIQTISEAKKLGIDRVGLATR
ncbi:MAG: biopolymer transporter ExbD [Burkholderiales bacterium RIFCSPLOWO2_02_FULL_57_36]|nr:MAG: biopolymer transporter ExbD [Burkholderiales bacterium RIFCSPLOWO2_02_FULL_57_36]